MKRLYIDFDGVVLDTIPYLYSAIEKNGIDFSNEREVACFFSKYDFKEIINDDNILNNSIENIKKIVDSNLFEISFLTHINSLDEGIVKVNYLRKYFDDINIILVPKEISKTKIVHSKDAILIDDYSGNLKEWSAAGGIPIKFDKELKINEFNVINDLSKIIDMFKKENYEN